jgi:hypothetical protein
MKRHKRTARRLVLKQEAIRSLTDHELAQVAAGDNQAAGVERKLTDSCVCGTTF